MTAVQQLAGCLCLIYVNLRGPASPPRVKKVHRTSLDKLVESKVRALWRLELVVLGSRDEMVLCMSK